MDQKYQEYISELNNDDLRIRLESLRKLKQTIDRGELEKPVAGEDVNNHIHTTYSFSPYSPAKAVWMAYQNGLATAGIMDHDSISGAWEFIEAGKIIGIATTIGLECRVDFSGTELQGKRINNPDQKSNVYMALHGIPHQNIETVREFFVPYVKDRNNRNRLMVERLNKIFQPYDIQMDFERDVRPLSRNHEGGSVTERHILFALARKIINKYGKGVNLLTFVKESLHLNVSPKIEKFLADETNVYYDYDLLGLLKSDLVSAFYIEANKECPVVGDAIKLAEEVGAISAYAYLGDVGDSVTGDKKSQKFEDDYLELLFQALKNLNFNAITYMPSRNTLAQLQRVKTFCEQNGFFQISGEDINSPRQSFNCAALRNPEFRNLIASTWALIGHEKAATKDLRNGLFTRDTIQKYPDLKERIKIYEQIGRMSGD